jgi:hypothetical protein
MMMTTTTTTAFTMHAYSLQHLILRWASTDVYERVYGQAHACLIVLFFFFILSVYMYISCISCSNWPK